MKERLLELCDRYKKFMESISSPTYEELAVNFPHDPSCSGTGKLVEGKKVIKGSFGGAFDPSITMITRSLTCEECRVTRDHI